MAFARETLKSLCKHVSVRQKDALSRSLASLTLGQQGGGVHELSGRAQSEVESKGFKVPSVGSSRNVSTSGHCSQISQLEADIAASDPAPGFQGFGSTTPRVTSFSIVPPALKPLTPVTPTPVAKLDAMMLAREMSNTLSHGRLEETVGLFDEWVKITDAAGNPNKPNILAYNLLLHAKLRLGAHPESMHGLVIEMENAGITPTQLTYNFVLRAVFRQRDSRLAEKILEKMEKAGPETQPDGDSYNFVIALCALDRRIFAALKHMQAMYERGFVPSKTTYNELLVACARVHQTQTAVAVLKELKTQQVLPQMQTMCELAIAATEVDDAECALVVLQLLNQRTGGKPSQALVMDEGGIVSLLSTAARTGSAALAKEAWALLKTSLNSGRAPGPAAYMALMHAWSTSGEFNSAFETLHEMQLLYGNAQTADELEVLSPFSSLRPLVLALARSGPAALDAAYFKLAEMHTSGQPVPLAAVNCVLLGCANVWDADRAYQTFESIGSTFGLMPDVHSVNALLDAFGKNRKIVEAVKLFEYMKEAGITPDQRSYELFITAHVVNRDIQSASAALTAMMDAGFTPCREVLFKFWRRCRREGDTITSDYLRRLFKLWGYRDCYIGEGRRRLITTAISTAQPEAVHS